MNKSVERRNVDDVFPESSWLSNVLNYSRKLIETYFQEGKPSSSSVNAHTTSSQKEEFKETDDKPTAVEIEQTCIIEREELAPDIVAKAESLPSPEPLVHIAVSSDVNNSNFQLEPTSTREVIDLVSIESSEGIRLKEPLPGGGQLKRVRHDESSSRKIATDGKKKRKSGHRKSDVDILVSAFSNEIVPIIDEDCGGGLESIEKREEAVVVNSKDDRSANGKKLITFDELILLPIPCNSEETDGSDMEIEV